MALYKSTSNGRIQMTEAEEAATLAQWAANDAAKIAEQETNGWARGRAKAYAEMASTTDQMALMQEQMQSMIDLGEITPTVDMTKLLSDIAKIKTDHPKPVR